MRFQATIELAGKTATGIDVPEEGVPEQPEHDRQHQVAQPARQAFGAALSLPRWREKAPRGLICEHPLGPAEQEATGSASS